MGKQQDCPSPGTFTKFPELKFVYIQRALTSLQRQQAGEPFPGGGGQRVLCEVSQGLHSSRSVHVRLEKWRKTGAWGSGAAASSFL